jgi:UDP-glucose 4-epimerase
MHFASYIQVGESVDVPAKYYRNNFCNMLNLLDAMVKHEVSAFIFSSTAAIFGEPDYSPIGETHSTNPINPYGRTKLMVEQALADYEKTYGLESVCLRYFNAAGADPDGELGERHEPETHLIPLILQAASGRRDSVKVFGNDYDSKDGTCVRGYIHINDLCEAHILGLERLWNGDGNAAFNLGNGLGFTVQEVIDAARRVSGREIKVTAEGRKDDKQKGHLDFGFKAPCSLSLGWWGLSGLFLLEF